MLASTMQFSRNNPTPTPPTHSRQARSGRTSHTPQKRPSRRTVPLGLRAASQPNSVSPPQTTQHTRFPHPPKGAVLTSHAG
jgi:hypothetical protein